MRRIVLGLLVLAVCGMMVAPVGMAGKPGGGGNIKYSTLTNDFQAGPTIGTWVSGGIGWEVLAYRTQNEPKSLPGGAIKILNSPNIWGSVQDPSTGKYSFSWVSHGETVAMFYALEGGAFLNPLKLPVGDYESPSEKIPDLHILIQMDKWGSSGNGLLILLCDNQIPLSVLAHQ